MARDKLDFPLKVFKSSVELSDEEDLDYPEAPPPKNNLWQKAITTFGVLSETSNIGIVIQIVSKWFPKLLTIGGGILSEVKIRSDALIYFFKILIRLTRIIGRNYFKVIFKEEENGVHPRQTAADIASLILFSLAIPLFAGTGALGETLAWTLALSGLSIVGYVDYIFQEKLAKEKYQNLVDLGAPEAIKNKAYQDFKLKQNATRLFMALLMGLSILLICGSAAAIAPPTYVPLLSGASKMASVFLSLIACGRFYNYYLLSQEKRVEKPEEKFLSAPTVNIYEKLDLQSSPKPTIELTIIKNYTPKKTVVYESMFFARREQNACIITPQQVLKAKKCS